MSKLWKWLTAVFNTKEIYAKWKYAGGAAWTPMPTLDHQLLHVSTTPAVAFLLLMIFVGVNADEIPPEFRPVLLEWVVRAVRWAVYVFVGIELLTGIVKKNWGDSSSDAQQYLFVCSFVPIAYGSWFVFAVWFLAWVFLYFVMFYYFVKEK